MGENLDADVLTQVEVLLKKLESAPENVKEAAILKIKERLITGPADRMTNLTRKTALRGKTKTRSHRRMLMNVGSSDDPSKLYSREYNVKEVLTSRGRRAKQINYSSDNGTGADASLETNTTIAAEEKVTNTITEETICDGSGLQAAQNGVGQNIFVVKTKENGESGKAGDEETRVEHKNELSSRESVSCCVCGKSFGDKSDLKLHLKEEHTNNGMYICQQCGHSYAKVQTLKIHMKRHRGERDFSCDNCDYRTYTKAELERHCAMHTGRTDDRSFVCHHCGKLYAVYGSLQKHVRDIHERANMHICEECGFTTYRAAYLQVHIRTVHHGNYNSHVCPVCGAHVKQRNAFLEHMRAHTGDRPYRCDKCSASFACTTRLTVHQKSVHGPRIYNCSSCNKAFQTKHHLERHQITHTKQRPFKCPYCSYSCNTQGNMIKHVRMVHGRPDFSYRRHRREQLLQKGVLPDVPDPEWVGRGEKVSQQYLEKLSEKLGRTVTVKELREKEHQRQKQRNIVNKYRKTSAGSKGKNPRADFQMPETADHSYVSTIKEHRNEKVLIRNKCAENSNSQSSDERVLCAPGTTVPEITSSSEADHKKKTVLRNERVLLVQDEGHKGEEIRLLVGAEPSKEDSQADTDTPTLQLVYHSGPRTATVVDTVARGSHVDVEGGYITSNFVALPGLETGKDSATPTVIVIVDTDQEAS